MIYLDNAATSAIKPPACREALKRSYRELLGNPGRGHNQISLTAAKAVYDTRCGLAQMFGTVPEHIIFTYNATYALNMAIKGTAREGTRIITTNYEHNSVLRPLYELRNRRKIELDILPVDLHSSENTLAALHELMQDPEKNKVSAVVVTAMSNTCGYRMPLAEIGRVCKRIGAEFIVDASQAAGCVPLDMDRLGIDLLCSAGHKGLYSITGVGFLAVGRNYQGEIRTFVEGGSGLNSRDEYMPDIMPEHLEGGTLGVPAIATLGAGVDFIRETGIEQIAYREAGLRKILVEGLSEYKDVVLYAPDIPAVSAVLFNIRGMECDTLGSRMDDKRICVRSGLHCSPLSHMALGSLSEETSGAVRVSVGYFNSEKDCRVFLKEIGRLIGEAKPAG